MTSGGVLRGLETLYQASDLTQLRPRLSQHLANLGFAYVGEYSYEERQGRFFHDSVWDSLDDWTAERIDAFFSAIREISPSYGPDGERRLLRWRLAQVRPYLTTSGEAAQFQVHRDYLNLHRDFGIPAAGGLVVPLPHEGIGFRAVTTLAATEADLRNVPEAVALIAAYHMKSRLCVAAERDTSQAAEVTAAGTDRPVALAEKEREILRWAAAGKTHQDIATITGLSQRTVRYHLERARDRYGFATVQQAIVRAALDYGLDPDG